MRISRIAVVAAALGSCVLCAAPALAALHPGDKVTIVVYNHPEISGDHTVDAAGNVSVPVAGTVSALNVEPNVLAQRVQDRLSRYVRYPAVNVQLLTQSASIFVAGGPNGVLPYAPGMTVTSIADRLAAPPAAPAVDVPNAQAVAQRDVGQSALDLENGPIDFHRVGVRRDGRVFGTYDVLAMRASGDPGPALQPNDTVVLVNKPIAVSVTGDVERPGSAYLTPEEPLAQAITQVGGLASSATESGLVLYRNGAPQPVSIGSATFAEPAQPGDRIVVPRAVRVDVIGNVQKPGETLLRGNDTLVSAIYYAGGPAKYANLRAVTVVHSGVRKQYDLRNLQHGGTSDNPQLVDGDLVLVPQGSTFEWSDVWGALGSLGLFGLRL